MKLIRERFMSRSAVDFIRKNIIEMAGYVPGEQPQEAGYVKLNTNENPYPPSPAVGDAIVEVLRRGLQKYPDPLATVFRVEAAKLLGVEPDWILTGNGSDDILTIVTRAFVGEGDYIRLAYPSYILYRVLSQLQNGAWEEVFFQGDWTLTNDFLASNPRLKLIFLANPNSPSGTMIPPAVISRWIEQLPCPILIDEAYVDFAAESCVDLVKLSDRVMVSRSLSKSYALAGLRFGYLVAQPHIIEQLRKVKDSYNCDALSIAGATAAIRDQNWLLETTRKVIRTRERMTEELRALGFDVVPSQANFVWCTRKDRPVKPIYEELKRRKVLVRYMDYPGWGDGLRISVGTDSEVDCLLERLQEVLSTDGK